jgi:hypothetical protein
MARELSASPSSRGCGPSGIGRTSSTRGRARSDEWTWRDLARIRPSAPCRNFYFSAHCCFGSRDSATFCRASHWGEFSAIRCSASFSQLNTAPSISCLRACPQVTKATTRVGLTGEKLQNEARTGFSWKCPGKLVTELAVVSSRRARLQAVVAQTWLAPGEHSRCMNREWESEIPNVSCRGSVGVRPQ